VLSDAQPGHYNLSRGVISALQRIQPVQESWVTVRLRIGLGRNILRLLLNHVHTPLPMGLLKLFYEMDDLPDQGCDLIVSAGGKTSFANAWLARLKNAPNVFTGSLRRLSSEHFSLVLTLEPIDKTSTNLVLELPPSALDERELEVRAARFRKHIGVGEQPCWCMLAGGDGAGYRYREPDWRALARLMKRLADLHDIRWLLVSSRRTGTEAEQLLAECLDEEVLAAHCWYAKGDMYSAEAWLGAAEKVFVTEDSMTMLTEAICARRPVFSLRPQQSLPNERYMRMVQRFANRGLIYRYALNQLAEQPELLNDARHTVLEESPQERLSKQLEQRLELT
jgi:mitochondrial fission protein ELM1